jgi:hypothetical protein
MARRNRALEWEVLSEEEWEQRNAGEAARQAAIAPVAPKKQLSWSHLVTMLLVVLVISGSTLYVVWRQTQAGQKRNTLLQAVVATATRSTPQNDDGIKVTAVEGHTMDNGIAIVEVTTMGAASHSYRYTQSSQQMDYESWEQTGLNIGFWGEEKSAETTYFHWYFRARDQAIVTQVAAQLDHIYLQLRHNLGLAPPSGTDKIVIDVQAGIPASSTPAGANHIIIASTLLLITPNQESQVEALRGRLFLLLIQETLSSAQAQQPVGCIWRSLLGGLAHWQLHIFPPTLFDHPATPEQAIPLLKELLDKDENCLDHPVTQLAATPDDPSTTDLGASFFAYAAERYGRDAVTALLTAFRRYSTWDDAIPAAFHTSKEAFEAGWQEYVLTQRAK